ncbi:MAG: hypothetical protein IT379_29165 [Deltaproteobacteria bacterium]|nr:hypothetical protein [Deltaproteobacteria bacterium]
MRPGRLVLALWLASCTRELDVLATRNAAPIDASATDASLRDARPDGARDAAPPPRDLGPRDTGIPADAGSDASGEDAGLDAGPGECATPGEVIAGETVEIPYASGASAPRIVETSEGFLLLYETDPRITGARAPALVHLDVRGGVVDPLAPIHALADGLDTLVAAGRVDDREVAVVRTLDGRLRAWVGDAELPEAGRILELDAGPGRVGGGAYVAAGSVAFLSHDAMPDAGGLFADLRLHRVSLDGTAAAPVELDVSFAGASRDARVGAASSGVWVTGVTGGSVALAFVDPDTGDATRGEGASTTRDTGVTGYSVGAAFGDPAVLVDHGTSSFLRYPEGSEWPVAEDERDPASGESRLGAGDFSLVAAFWPVGRRAPRLRGYPSFGGVPPVTAELDDSAVPDTFVRGLGIDIAENGDVWAVAYGVRVARADGSETDVLYVARVRFCVPLGGA